MIQAQRNKYLENTVQTASPAQLLIMLCDGAIRFCRAGIEALKNHNHQDANTNLVKVQDIISEFTITLDRNAPIAEDLLRLYEYFNHRLIEANIKKTAEPAEEVLGYLIELKETWLQAAKQMNAGPNAAPVGT
ncbi:flagellar export chaperone FliS [Paenibacillus whitsoniae]|uniref:Flagellar secretion chaperone FliS n=1 Tax=Paenibacillus whitsoniae TaxID=2496558 RepID=A0A430JAH7_9BACL|nr:flagellar export chaperone FliS [Paenibacillus whitsoniae]RTE07942.1 flagellar export chaperone FliS [Paenibacillus whitsoniae]